MEVHLRGKGKGVAPNRLAELNVLMSRYTTNHLISVSPQDFEAYIRSQMVVKPSPGLDETWRQRTYSVKFTWGHTHDFGSFSLKGAMGNRHVVLMDNFCRYFPITLDDFKDASVLDIGCWTGGTTLLLAALGSQVNAIEEVPMYAHMAAYLAASFGLSDRVNVFPMSLYRYSYVLSPESHDIVYCPGVIYHLTDPVIALRIMYNSLGIGGKILIESAAIGESGPTCQFMGASNAGWNWFFPSQKAMKLMMEQVGFESVQTTGGTRLYAFGVKERWMPITRAGLSMPEIS
jgi:SAM-dependent methyltransferase